ncbi:MAG: hypothetical protein VKO21_01740 [Candidatus Sericytochromatia bacterium]|nr:hypothetical protein [Candidatus Sericytochromatia bacterium]
MSGTLRVIRDAGVVARLRHRGRREGRGPGRVVVIHGARAGAGCSTLAASLAWCWARSSGPVLLVDLALQGADQDLLWQVTPQHRLEAVLEGEVPVHEAWTGMPGGVRLLLGPVEPLRGQGPDPWALERLLGWMADRHPVVIVDTSAGYDEANRAILARADRVLVPVPAEITQLRAARALPALWASRGLASDRFSFLLARRPGGPERELASRILDRPLDGIMPWVPDASGSARDRGVPLVSLRSGRSYLSALEDLARRLWPETGLGSGWTLPWWPSRLRGGRA